MSGHESAGRVVAEFEPEANLKGPSFLHFCGSAVFFRSVLWLRLWLRCGSVWLRCGSVAPSRPGDRDL